MDEVKNLPELLAPYIGPKKKIVSSDVSRLTAPGENYLSVVLKIDVVVEDVESGKQETINGVGKCIIHGNNVGGWFNELTKLCFKKEVIWYTEILPTLQNFVKKNENFTKNFDIFPKLIAHRYNLHGENDEIDDNSILLIENLAVKGFRNIERQIGFDYDGAKRILRDLATFHAVPIALKLKEPQIFEQKIKKHLKIKKDEEKKDEEKKDEEKFDGTMDNSKMWLGALGSRADCQPFMTKLEHLFDEVRQNKKIPWNEKTKTEPFATIEHQDMWVNNTLQVLNGDRVMDNKFLDFQIYSYHSPAHDVLFFIWSSVQLPVVKEHFDDLLKYYHKNFLETLVEFSTDVSPFTYDKFEEELKISADYQLVHILDIIQAVCGKKGEFAFDLSSDTKPDPKPEDVSEEIREKVAFALKICCERGWL